MTVGPEAKASPALIDALDPLRYGQFLAASEAIETMGASASITVDELAHGEDQSGSLTVVARLRALAAIGPAAKAALPAISGPKPTLHTNCTALVALAVERINGTPPSPPPGGYRVPPLTPAAAGDIALARIVLESAWAQEIPLGGPAPPSKPASPAKPGTNARR